MSVLRVRDHVVQGRQKGLVGLAGGVDRTHSGAVEGPGDRAAARAAASQSAIGAMLPDAAIEY